MERYLYYGYVMDNLASCFTSDEDPTFFVDVIPVVEEKTTEAGTVFEFGDYFPTGFGPEDDYVEDSLCETRLDIPIGLKNGTIIYSFNKQMCTDFIFERKKNFLEALDQHINYLNKLKSYVLKEKSSEMA